MLQTRESTAQAGEPNAVPSKIIQIVPHHKKRRKSRKHIIAVKAITVSSVFMTIYGLLLLEFHPVAGTIIFALSFPYLMTFAYVNGGLS